MKRVKIIFACVIAILVCFGLVACQKTNKTNRNNEKILDSGETDERASVLSIKNGKVDGLDIYLEVSPDIELIDLSGMIKTTKNCSWKLYAAPAVTEDLANATKTIAPSKGNNIYFVVVTSANGKVDRTYRLNVFKNYYATLTFTFDNAVVAQEEVLTHTVYNGLGPVCRDPAFISWDCQGCYIEGDKTIEARAIRYDVTFLTSTGEIIEKQSVIKNRLVDRPQDPVSEDGLIFSGWNTEKGELWDIDVNGVVNNVSLIANWKVKKGTNGSLFFGKFPKTVKDESTKERLMNIAGELPTLRNQGKWGKTETGEWLIEIIYDNQEYTGFYTGKGDVRWIKNELLEWFIIKEVEGKAFVVSKNSVAELPFDEKGNNNYAKSTIREWLNTTFYNMSFKSGETRKKIVKTEVDNSLASTEDETNENVCETTNDYVFLLSERELGQINLKNDKKEEKQITGWSRTPGPKNKDEAKQGYIRWYKSTWGGDVYWGAYGGASNQMYKTTEKQSIYPALWISL